LVLYSDGDGFTDDWFCLRVVETGGFAYGGAFGVGVEEDGAGGEGGGGLYGFGCSGGDEAYGWFVGCCCWRQDVGWRRALLSILLGLMSLMNR